MTNFIFMLTHNDVTIPNAIEVFEKVKRTGISHVGFKDVGLTVEEQKRLVKLIRKEHMNIHMEVVSETREATIRSVRRAVELEVDYLIGGTYIEPTLQLIRGSGIKYFPYVGKVVEHPCLLRGTIEEIVGDAKRVEELGVDGINLLAYRYDGDVDQLMISVQHTVNIPLIVAGSIDRFARIRRMTELGIWGFTIGSAVFEKKFVPESGFTGQITAVLTEIAKPRD